MYVDIHHFYGIVWNKNIVRYESMLLLRGFQISKTLLFLIRPDIFSHHETFEIVIYQTHNLKVTSGVQLLRISPLFFFFFLETRRNFINESCLVQ